MWVSDSHPQSLSNLICFALWLAWIVLVVALCSWLVRASTMNGMGRKVLNDLERVSLIMLEMGL